MSIAAFCREHRFPQRRVLRLVKERIRSSLDGPEEESWAADLTEEIGVAAEHREGSSRITYEVTDTEAFYDFVAAELGIDLLRPEEIEHVAKAARAYHDMIMGLNDYDIVRRGSREPLRVEEGSLDHLKFYKPLNEALKKMGM